MELPPYKQLQQIEFNVHKVGPFTLTQLAGVEASHYANTKGPFVFVGGEGRAARLDEPITLPDRVDAMCVVRPRSTIRGVGYCAIERLDVLNRDLADTEVRDALLRTAIGVAQDARIGTLATTVIKDIGDIRDWWDERLSWRGSLRGRALYTAACEKYAANWMTTFLRLRRAIQACTRLCKISKNVKIALGILGKKRYHNAF